MGPPLQPPARFLQQPGLSAPVDAKAALSAPANAKAEKSAREFEAMAIGQLLQPMFATVDSAHSLFGGGAGEETWKPMLVNEIAKKIAANGGFGLARPVLAEMLRLQEARKTDPVPPNPLQPRQAP